MIARLVIGLATAILALAFVLIMLTALPVQLLGIWLLKHEEPMPAADRRLPRARADYYRPLA